MFDIIQIVVKLIFIYIAIVLIANIRLNKLGNEILDNPDNELVEAYISMLKFIPINNHPRSWNKLRSVFFGVYNSENVSKENKKALHLRLVKKGCSLGNVNLDYMTKEERKRKSGEDGERNVAYNLKWLPKEYKVLYNVRLLSSIESQEFDNIIIGPTGIFHIETKNYGGDYGCKIKIDKDGNWIREYNGHEYGEINPKFQLSRHQKVLEENIEKHYGKDSYEVNGIIVLSNPKTVLEGAENSDVTVIKVEELENFIINFKTSRPISKEEIKDIYLKLK